MQWPVTSMAWLVKAESSLATFSQEGPDLWQTPVSAQASLGPATGAARPLSHLTVRSTNRLDSTSCVWTHDTVTSAGHRNLGAVVMIHCSVKSAEWTLVGIRAIVGTSLTL